MHLACLTPNPKWVICLLPAKNTIYRYCTDLSVILRSGCTLQYAILPISVWRFHCNPLRPLVRTPSCSSMNPKWSGTQITSKNAKISTLAGYFITKFWWTFNLYIMIIYPKFAPILRSQKKVDFSCSGSTQRQTDSWDRKGKVKGTKEEGGVFKNHPLPFIPNLPSFII